MNNRWFSSIRRFSAQSRAIRLAAVLFIGVLLALFSFQSISAHLDFELPGLSFHPYHFTADRGDTGPINLIFIGDLDTTLDRFRQHFPRAGVPLLASVMQFEDHGVVDDQDAQLTVGNPLNRLHVRFEEGYDSDPDLGMYTLASVHKDVSEFFCLGGHKGIEFNEQRDRVVEAFQRSNHSVTFVNLENTNALRQCDNTYTTGDGRTAIIGPPPVDVYMLVDLSGSFADDLPNFKAQAPTIISTLKTANPDTRFGLGKYEDYPIPPFGSEAAGDKAYERLVDLTFDTELVLNTISALFTRFGGDGPQSQLPALYQAATGDGQDLSESGFPEASIPAGQQANFRDGVIKIFLIWTDAPFHRPGDPGAIQYPGPSFEETADAINALDPPKVIGISSGTAGNTDLAAIAAATNAFAPSGGADCDGDGSVDIPAGEPLVCSISSSGQGIGDAVVSLVDAASVPALIKVNIDIKPGSDPNSINLEERGLIPVAIITTEDFDATKVDPLSVEFGPDAAIEEHGSGHVKDADGDGDLDLILHFRAYETGIQCLDMVALLTGVTFDGQIIEGTDFVNIVKC